MGILLPASCDKNQDKLWLKRRLNSLIPPEMMSVLLVLPTACDKDFDLSFVIDGSGSIEQAGKGNFKKVKDFVKRIIGGFNIGEDKTHVGAVIYSSSQYVKKVFGLDSYFNLASLERAIDKIPYPSGGTFTGKAITLATTDIYTSSKDRSDIPNVCIVITDGKATDSIDGASRTLRSKGTTIIAIGVGQNYDEAELIKMAGSRSNVYTADFSDLGTVIEDIKQSACQGWSYSQRGLWALRNMSRNDGIFIFPVIKYE